MRRCLHVQRAALRCSARRRLSSVGSAAPTTNYKFVSLTPELFPQGYGGDLEEDKEMYVFEGGGGASARRADGPWRGGARNFSSRVAARCGGGGGDGAP
jgi:hypothetical protein